LRETPIERRRSRMKTYIVLCNLTQKGIEKIKDGPARLDEAKKAFEAMGARIKDFYLVMGRYDLILVVEGPDDETAAKLALSIGSQGALRSETLSAHTEDEYRRIIAALP
jgi:uncharacterized protein with GYD domain